jgi:SWI/SNF-related matrix-associated actin-dependent regulator 1 of chromatin subfamily A
VSDLSLYPHQEEGVAFLKAQPQHALLWDEQRVGKTPQAIVASGEMGLRKVVVVTPVSGVGVWRHQWKQWDRWDRLPFIVPWSKMSAGGFAIPNGGMCDLVILDEGHYAKSFAAERTRSVYGLLHGPRLVQDRALLPHARRVWHLTGTPAPHDPGDLFPVLIALFPHLLRANPAQGFPDVTTFEKFRSRYCVMTLRRIGGRMIRVVLRGQNLDELNRRLKGVFLRRRQADVGIKPAFWDLLPIEISARDRAQMEAAIDGDAILRAMRNRQPLVDLEPMLAPIRRITGTFKARGVITDAKDWLENGEKLVVAYWHKDTGDALEQGLAKFRPVRVDGSITGDHRTTKVAHFHADDTCRVFLAQIAACGEAIDLSAASEMWFAESVFTPAMMAQMGARITNLRQRRQCLVRVAALEDSIDELIQGRLIDLSRSIAHTLGENYNENFARHRV